MSINDFKNALREVISSDFDHIPSNESSIDYVFSESFNRKMEKLIRVQKKSYYILINTAAKRAAIIFVAILTLFSASMSVKAIREPVVDFIIETYEKFTKYFFKGDTLSKIEDVYTVTKVPEGFTQTQKIENRALIITIFEDANNNCIKIKQSITDGFEININNEEVNYYYEQVDGKVVTINTYANTHHLTWTDKQYCFEIITYGKIDIETVLEMIKHIQ